MTARSADTSASDARSFTEDVAFLRRHVETIVLEEGEARVAVVPAYQGRVMTSTTGGPQDPSFGWLNYPVIESGVLTGAAAEGKLQAHIHVFGGEERFWLGPEGGQFGIYFAPGASFVFDDWRTPPPIDTEPFHVESQSATEVTFQRRIYVTNHSGFTFDVGVLRRVRLLNRSEIGELLGEALPDGVRAVAYETVNGLTNLGDEPWTKASGTLSVWLLGMYKHSAETTVVIPFREGAAESLGPKVNDEYFGKVPGDRLQANASPLYFRADGKYRSKIGVSPERSLGVAGSFAADSDTLNLVLYDPPTTHEGYVNSMWEQQTSPFSGDAINAYNDGPPEPGADPLGPFYELETSSPAAFLASGESLQHVQRTIHLRGERAALDSLAQRHLKTRLEAIKSAF